ncbi:MAG: hypothetical protein RL250_1687 [Verrucomicrobiota bacterium]
MGPHLREPVTPTLWALPGRERTVTETILIGASVVVFVGLLADRFGELHLGLIGPRSDWLSVVPALWLAQTVRRGWRQQPFDRTSIAAGLCGILPYLAFGGRSSAQRPPLPDRWWLGLALFGGAFILGFILERRPKES